jgi:glutamate racemase
MILAEALVRSHVDALKRRMPKPQAAILGCTHYPLVEDVFRDALGPDVAVFSQPDLVADSLAHYLKRRPEFAGVGTPAFLTTGNPKSVETQATLFLRRKISFEAVG